MQETQTHIETALERFNPAQREAATETDGPMLVIAGAGSGKTSVLTTRIAVLMSRGVAPERILALTFTKKAAEEMRERIIAIQGEEARKIEMGTFHSVFIRFLRPYAGRLGFPQGFTVLDEDDSDSCLKRCINAVIGQGRPPKEEWTKEMAEAFAKKDKHYKVKTIKGIISACKNELVTADAYASNAEQARRDNDAMRPLTGRIFVDYRNQCFRMGMMDFDDILLYTDMLLANHPDVRAAIAGSYDYILVDEYQDTNYAQYSILRRLTEINKNICVVGDDSQSIYAFRGARIENIFSFSKDYPGCRIIKLEQNYRSTSNIVCAANNIISHNSGRIPKTCFSKSEKGGAILIKTAADEKDEASYIASTILDRKEGEGKAFTDFAVLYRTNAQSRAIEDALMKKRIPYTIYSGTSFFSRMEVKDLMAYYRLAVNPNDDEAFLRVVNKPVRGVGAKAQQLIATTARAWGCSIWQAVTHPQFALCGIQPKAMVGVRNFIDEVVGYIEMSCSKGAFETAAHISDKVGFYAGYMSEGNDEATKRADNIRELVDSVKSYEEELQKNNETLPENMREPSTLASYLQNVMLLSNADTGDENGGVTLMTVHCAKGLEFDTVYVAGVEKGLFPLEIDGTEFEGEEERRLFYVAVTRAKTNLILTKAESRLKFGKRTFSKPSPFLSELRRASKK